MNDLVLQAFAASDFDELLPMWRQAFEFGVGITDPNPLSAQAAYFWREVAARHRVQVACEGGHLVGFVAATDESVAQLHVRVGHHRQGIGTALLDWAKAQSVGQLWLYTFAQNARARAFYEKHGFRATVFGFEPTWQLADVRYEWRRDAAPPA
jgi:ribosomal protein S18 acetylase RimI-like enzyme